MNNNIKSITTLGISGSTSLDGLGLSLMETDGIDVYRQGTSYIVPYEDNLLEQIYSILGKRADSQSDMEKIQKVQKNYTEFAVKMAKEFINDEGLRPDIIGFAGHTTCHRPQEHYTHQIGDGQMMANLMEIKTIAHFRNADILAGGQGAPFAPVYYQALTSKMEHPLVVIDIGGTAEIVWFGSNGEMKAFVSGPGNAIINDWVIKHSGQQMDYNGRLAISGKTDEKILATLMHHKYIALNPPKACDRTIFLEKAEHLEGLSLEDGAATATSFVAESIAYSMALFLPEPPQRVIVCGGGAKNPTLMRFIRQRLSDITIETAVDVGWQPEAVDAQEAAFWAVRRLYYLPISFPSTTGAVEPVIGGEIFEPSSG